ncbi:MAG: hypothetical protein IJM37_02955 [Lachnospiraceae bacterium]|nr:hypothetical protein [Lachnospiraceae bacterium]
MKLDNILKKPKESLEYMERLVNDGSPSNFSFINTTSRETCPLYASRFNLCAIIDQSSKIETIGKIPLIKLSECSIGEDYVFAHPDWRNRNITFDLFETDFSVIPTSSSRTVKLENYNYYIKMCYPGILGRITRELEVQHINSSIDITNVLNTLTSCAQVPSFLSFFPETGGKIFKYPEGEIGYVVRDSTPIGKKVKDIHAIIPAFSLYSQDRGNDDPAIINQILDVKSDPISYLLEQIVFKVVDCFFSCVFIGGIQPEMHSQNFLLGIDKNLDVCSIILRDLESVDKDITIRKELDLSIDFLSYPFKCIDKNQYNYKIKHSFMYDHKLGEYFFSPLLDCIRKSKTVNTDNIETEIKNYVNNKYGDKLFNFFPDNNMWYKFKNVLIDRSSEKRPYIQLDNPRYR